MSQRSYVGEVEYFDRSLIKGWALDPNAPEHPISIEVLAAGRIVAEVTASTLRWDLRSRFESSGNHGFVYVLPPTLLAKADGRFEIRFTDSGVPLANSPIEIGPLAERLHAPFVASTLTGRRVLLLAPHPDDESFTCGGSLILHAMRADPVKVVFLTDGSEADTAGRSSRARYVGVRRSEASRACSLLGVGDIEFWDLPDRELQATPELLDRLHRLLTAYRPELIYAPSPLEFHPDHRAAAELVWRAVARAGVRADVAFYESDRPIHVNCLVNIDATHERKIRACRAYASQMQNRPYIDVVNGLSRFRSLTVSPGVDNAEGFFLLSSAEIASHPIDWFTVRQYLPMTRPPDRERPLVSIVIRTKDRPVLLREALASVLAQTYPDLEVVIVNAGTQDLESVVAAFESYFPILQVPHGAPLGRAAAATAGVRAARGKYVNFLDDDDVLYSQHVEKLAGFLDRTGEAVAYSDCERRHYCWQDGRFAPSGYPEPLHGVEFDRDRLLVHNFLPFMTVMFARSLAERVGYFDDKLDVLEDWDFWIRLSACAGFHRVPGVTAEYRCLVERPHGEQTETVHRKHHDLWTDSSRDARSRIQTLQEENAKLGQALAEVYAELGTLHGRLTWQVMQSAERALRRFRLEALLSPDLPVPALGSPFADWRREASTPFYVIEGLQHRNVELRLRLADAERRLRLIRRSPLSRVARLIPKTWLDAAHRAFRRVERARAEKQLAETVQASDEINVRPYRPGDEAHILRLFRLCFGKLRDPRHWAWKFAQHPWGNGRILVAATRTGDLVAHYGGYPCHFLDTAGDEPAVMSALQIGDTMTSPRVRHLGRRRTNLLHRISQRYFSQYCEGQVHFIFGFNTGKIQRYYLRLVAGMQLFEDVPYMTLQLDRTARAKLRERASRDRALSVRRVFETDASWDAFYRDNAPEYGLLTERVAAYVRWRYLQAPDVDYRVYSAYASGALVGWSVFRREADRLVWGDGMFARAHAGAFASILRHALTRFGGRRIQIVEGWFSNRPQWWREAIAELGFEPHVEPDGIGMMFKCFLAPDLRAAFERRLYYTKGDSDLF